MSGLIGHTMYGILARNEARARGLPIAGLLARHEASYLCGAYLGCDIQTMPEAVCVDTGREVGFGTVPVERSPITGGPVRPWSLAFDGGEYRPRAIHDRFYGRAHLIFGWTAAERGACSRRIAATSPPTQKGSSVSTVSPTVPTDPCVTPT